MKPDTISLKLAAIVLIGGVCFLASLLVLGLTHERASRSGNAKAEIAEKWGRRQVIVGPMIIKKGDSTEDTDTYILPETLLHEATLESEVRSRGIFKSAVYTSTVKVSGEFLAKDIAGAASQNPKTAIFSVAITDTRGIEEQFELIWNDIAYPFNPGPGIPFENSSGLHAIVLIGNAPEKIPFSFTIQLKGSEDFSVAPLGKETVITMSSPWPAPKFTGAFLPSTREIDASGFTAEWRISSFGRPYPQVWKSGEVNFEQLVNSSAGVALHETIDTYDMILRSVRYAVLFIVITFAAFFLFDVLAKIKIHPIQYLLIGSALSLFYLLVLSLAEQIGFLFAYMAATVMIALLVTGYSAFVLKSRRRALQIFVLLVILYGYLYFVLKLEDYALLFGSLLLFILLAVIMYTTRTIDWFTIGKAGE